MTSPVKLHVYDLSSGLARQLSQQLTGRQIDGIWYAPLHLARCAVGLTVAMLLGIHPSLYLARRYSMARESALLPQADLM